MKTIAIRILTNDSKSKDDQTMECGQLIEYNMRKIVLEKSYAKCGVETSRRKKSKLKISLDQKPKVLCRLILLRDK